MESVVLEIFVKVVLKEFVNQLKNQLTQGEDVIRWIEYESETLIPQLERIEAATENDLAGKIRDEIRRAEDLAGTHTKREMQRDAATFKLLFYEVKVWKTSRQLHRSKAEISRYRDELLQQQHNVPALTAQEEQTVPAYLRRCMHYLLLFPPNNPVPARRLIVLWVAEGLVHSKKHGGESAEQIAHGYLDELERRGLILKQEKPGGKATYSIDAVKREERMKEAEKAGFFHVNAKNADSSWSSKWTRRVGHCYGSSTNAKNAESSRDNKGVRRLVDCYGSTASPSPSFIQIHGENATFPTSDLKRYYKEVVSFLSFNTREGSKPGEDIGDFLGRCISARCFIWLRVLDLERVFRPKLPDTLGELIAIKYLGLRWTYLEKLPDSVDKLINLLVLDVKHTYISLLPKSIWRMQYLQHLYLNEAYRTRFPPPPSKVTLNALQTLWGAFVDEETVVQGGLDKLINIRKLGLSCRSSLSTLVQMSIQLGAIDKWISNLEFLETLRLKSRDDENRAVDLSLSSLARNRKLSTLYLLGKLGGRVVGTLPASLTSITLAGSHLNLDPMGFLGRLPNLITLRLLGQSVTYEKLSCSRRGFRKLKLLWIWKLESLVAFEAEEGSLPCLEELEIRDCQKLEKLPCGLKQRQTLKVKFTIMPQDIVEEARGIYDQFEQLELSDLQSP